MIWLRLRAFISRAALPLGGRRALWIVSGLLMFGTLLVEAPFLAHRAGTSEPHIAVLTAAYLANASLCLIVYGEAKFGRSIRVTADHGCLLRDDSLRAN